MRLSTPRGSSRRPPAPRRHVRLLHLLSALAVAGGAMFVVTTRAPVAEDAGVSAAEQGTRALLDERAAAHLRRLRSR